MAPSNNRTFSLISAVAINNFKASLKVAVPNNQWEVCPTFQIFSKAFLK